MRSKIGSGSQLPTKQQTVQPQQHHQQKQCHLCYRRMLLWMTTCGISIAVYWDEKALRGPFVYDDIASIVNNPVVTSPNKVPWTEAFVRDFWGRRSMDDARSHKSFRPLTTLSFRFNYNLLLLRQRRRQSMSLGRDENDGTKVMSTSKGDDNNSNVINDTYYFHCINIILHGINTGLVAETADVVFGGGGGYDDEDFVVIDLVGPWMAGILFGIHPIHAEAVSNITSRGELGMTFFFLLGFLSYVKGITITTSTIRKSTPTTTTKSMQRIQGTSCHEVDTGIVAVGGGGNNNNTTSTTAVPTTCRSRSRRRRILFVYILPWLMTALSMLSKEQGITTLCSAVSYDFIRHYSSVREFLSKLLLTTTTTTKKKKNNNSNNNTDTRDFLKRAGILAIQTLVLVHFRIRMNGNNNNNNNNNKYTVPNFVYEQNPAGFSKNRFTRIFSVNWTYCLYLLDMIYPAYLAPDWSGDGIPLIESFWSKNDIRRVKWVLLLWTVVGALTFSLVVGGISSTKTTMQHQKKLLPPAPEASEEQQHRDTPRRILLISFFSFSFLPFLLSSNILVTTGFAKADRVMYLPLLGFCLMEAWIVKTVWRKYYNYTAPVIDDRTSFCRPTVVVVMMVLVLVLVGIQLAWYGFQVHERNLAWADEYTLWTRAYEINPRSRQTMFFAGKALMKQGEYERAEQVLRPIGRNVRATNGDPNTSFLYAVALGKLDRCIESLILIEDAIQYIHEQRDQRNQQQQQQEKPGLRPYDDDDDIAKMSLHSESSLMVARAFCTNNNVMEKGRILYEAARMDSTNAFAQDQLYRYLQTLQQLQTIQQQHQQQQKTIEQPLQAQGRR